MDASLRPDDIASTADRMADETLDTSAAATARDPLPIVLKAAFAHIERGERDLRGADGHYTSAALRFKELKDRVQAGEAGEGVSWADYCAANIPSLTQRTVDSYVAMVTLNCSWEFDQAPEERLDLAAWEARVWEEQEPTIEDEAWDEHKAWKAMHTATDQKQAAEEALAEEIMADLADAKPTSSAKRREQNAKAQARRRAKSSTIREANGGKASKPRQDRETTEQYQKLASLAKVLDAGQLQIINEIIEERWPGTWDKASKAKTA